MRNTKIFISIILFIITCFCKKNNCSAQESKSWSRTNLNVNTFRNGDTIMESKTEEEWKNASKEKKPAWCHYNNDSLNGQKYGKLYNWFAVIDPRGLAPIGWHLPTDREWDILIDSYGGLSKTANVLMVTCKGLNSGFRFRNGKFSSIGVIVSWWIFTPGKEKPIYRSLNSSFRGSITKGIAFKGEGLSVRCIKD